MQLQGKSQSGSPDNTVIENAKTHKPKVKVKRLLFSGAAVLLAATIGLFALFATPTTAAAMASYINYLVAPTDITLSLSGTGSLSPADSYTVTTLISGEILSAAFEEGDTVQKDTVLYEVDSSSVATSIEQSEIALAQSRRSYEQKVKSLDNLKIKANESGKIVELFVEKGDTVSAGQTIATIRNSSTMSLEVPFGSDDVLSFYVGQPAEVTIDGSFEKLSGTVAKIGVNEDRLDGNRLVRTVTIDVQNPGGITPGQAATAMVGGAASSRSGTFSYKSESVVTAAIAGEVSAIHYKEGQLVQKDQVLVTLTSDTLQNDVANGSGSLRDSELSLQSRKNQLNDYTITSPISGTIIEKNYKEGDTLEAGRALCTIFDLSYLTMTLNVDELDIANIAVGQTVTVTAEALPGKTYTGYVTKININGTSSNGVTAYPVQIRIDETDGLLPGMNAQAEIIVTTRVGVAAIPVEAITRGNRVLVQTDPAMTGIDAETGLPAGFVYIEVTPGINDGRFIEIVDGLSPGDVIAYAEEIIPQTSGFSMPGGEGGFAAGRTGGN